MSTLLLFKFTVTPILVALMSLAARRFGATIGGIIIGLPWMTGPILFFLGLERGDSYLAQAARGALLAIPAISTYALSYALVARRFSWPVCFAAGASTFAATGWLIADIGFAVDWIAALAVAALVAVQVLIQPPRKAVAMLSPPWWDIPARMLATATLIGCITIAANYVPPTRLGIVSSFPVIMTVITTFTHRTWGLDAAMAMLRGIMLSLLGFVAFFWVVARTAEPLGLVRCYIAATVAGIVVSLALVLVNRARARR